MKGESLFSFNIVKDAFECPMIPASNYSYNLSILNMVQEATKRLHEDKFPSFEQPARKRPRGISAPTIMSRDGEDVLFLPWPLIPSPLAETKYEPDSPVSNHLKAYGPVVQRYFRKWNALDTHQIRKDILSACDGEHLVWADPYEPHLLKSADALRL